MIVQCQACQTRFRLADEKVKPGGTKVRCSKCKEIFTVMPPEPEPEPVEESVDFGSFNMEAVTDESAEDSEPPQEEAPEQTSDSEAVAQPGTSEEGPSDELDFSGLEEGMGDSAGSGEELADDFSFADTSEPAEKPSVDESPPEPSTDDSDTVPDSDDEEADFGAAFEETADIDDPGAIEFDFNEQPDETSSPSESFEFDSVDDDSEKATDFSFDDNETDAVETGDFSLDAEPEDAEQQDTAEFSFGDDDDSSFNFDEEADSSSAEDKTDEFSFDEDNPFDETTSSEWGDGDETEGASFDFEEPQFDNAPEAAAQAGAKKETEDGGLQFGEIDFASDDDDSPQSGAIDEDFASATMETQPEEESFAQREQSAPPPSRDYDSEEPLPAPPPPKKSSLSRILVLLVLLLVILGGATAFLFMQGTANLNMVTEYLPFLKDYIGEPQQVSPADSIDIDISGSAYVNNAEAGQMLVIQGAAINKHPQSRSSITIKGVLLDSNGKTLLQQTVFCGNQLTTSELETLPFKQIEEAMNNEFGTGLSNMNISPGASIPFTIVFRNLPDGIANIHVEVVDSKPGAS